MNGWNFLRLIGALREASIAVSSQDVFELQLCMERFPFIADKEIFKALLIRKPQDALTFETIWRIILDSTQGDADPRRDKKVLPLGEEKESGPNIGGLGIGPGFGGVSLTNSASAAGRSLIINHQKLAKLMDQGIDFEDLVNAALADMDYYAWINSYDLAYQRGSLTEEEWYSHQKNRLALLGEVKQSVLEAQVRQENSWQPLVRQHWLFKPLNNLSDQEKSLVKSSIRKWARKLAVRPGQRWKASHNKGMIDIARIVRQSAQRNGVVFALSYRRKIPRASELVVLCDVSNSMAAYVEFLIVLVSCLRGRFRKVRVYFFIDTVWDVSDFVWHEDLEEIKQEIKSWGHRISLGYSDYGAVFKELAENYLTDVSSRATVILLGDGKNNYRSSQKEFIAQIFENVRHIFWLNPLNIEEWNEPDNIMKDYQPYYTRAYRCRSADDLQNIVKDVF
ncbi:VWA domain-containing protein [Desulfosporosinus sp. PR]|uniref:VWA domain-containing protein n=1 Tax=Candidatus Desulfosporosinus nitrosoreducens TaxID=3401928 RepID=UPI0027FE33F0|nr:VWA domain-containing protein [Desulfosporosinus sp. PR]MDQ7094518.1 VWA domain-containing protein [Desulfosporosinus sp. PR]